jgi:peroxiredoxin Q/BCP
MGSHQRFCDKLQLPFPLLVDTDRSVAQAYGAVKENGKSILRTVVIIDKAGTIQYIKRGLPPDQELLDSIGKV